MWGAKVRTPINMPDDMLKDAIETVTKELSEINIDNFENDGLCVVQKIKDHMDELWTPSWHVIIGRNFGSMVTHESKKFLYFYYNNKAVMMYKAG